MSLPELSQPGDLICPACGRGLSRQAEVGDRPECPGKIVICGHCAHAMVLDERLHARDLTRAEAEEVRTNPHFSRVRRYQERVIDEQNLIG